MEEIKLCLTGFSSGLFEFDAAPGVLGRYEPEESILLCLSSAEVAAASKPKPGQLRRHRLNTNSSVFTRLHPSEQELLLRVLPLGEDYQYLQQHIQDTRIGSLTGSSSSSSSSPPHPRPNHTRGKGFYATAVCVAVDRILEHYLESVQLCYSPSGLQVLEETYALTFRLLCHVFRLTLVESTVGQQSGPSPASSQQGKVVNEEDDKGTDNNEKRSEKRRREGNTEASARLTTVSADNDIPIHVIEDFLSNQEVPRVFRQWVGESVWLSLLHTIAHYIAHGVVLYGRDSFFVHVTNNNSSSSTVAATEGKEQKEEHTLYTDKLPKCISVDLGTLIVSTGRERRALLNESVGFGGDYLERLALGAQDEAAETVFQATFSPSLCVGGHLQAEELYSRVSAARALWSKALWKAVGDTAALHRRLHALRDIFLCQRGDLWSAFSENLFTAYFSQYTANTAAASTTTTAAGGVNRIASLSRIAAESFQHAFTVSGLLDRGEYEPFRLVVSHDGQSSSSKEVGYSVEDVARRMLSRGSDIGVQYTLPPGLGLIVSNKMFNYYQRLFSFHIVVRLGLEALRACRPSFREAMLTNPRPSADLRETFALYHQLQFLLQALLEYLQVDVHLAATTTFLRGLAKCGAVEEARRLHDRFMWEITEGAFLAEGAEVVFAACRALCLHSMSIYVLCRRYKLTFWAVEGVNETPVEVKLTIQALRTRVQQEVLAPFVSFLSDRGGSNTNSNNNEVSVGRQAAALWTRMDFNRFYSQFQAAQLHRQMGSVNALQRNPFLNHDMTNNSTSHARSNSATLLARPSIHTTIGRGSNSNNPNNNNSSSSNNNLKKSKRTSSAVTPRTTTSTTTTATAVAAAVAASTVSNNSSASRHAGLVPSSISSATLSTITDLASQQAAHHNHNSSSGTGGGTIRRTLSHQHPPSHPTTTTSNTTTTGGGGNAAEGSLEAPQQVVRRRGSSLVSGSRRAPPPS